MHHSFQIARTAEVSGRQFWKWLLIH